MTKKIAALILFTAMTASLLASCSHDGEKLMEMPSMPVDSFECSECAEGTVLVRGENHVSDRLFRYFYLLVKDNLLSDMRRNESAGYDMTGGKDIPVDDTEAFWNCVYPGKEEGAGTAMKDILYDYTVDWMKNLLAAESIARDYCLTLPADYREKLEKAIADDIAQNGSHYLDGDISFADEDGAVFGWAKDRRKMHLASRNMTERDWERIFFLSGTIAGKLQDHLESLGVLRMEEDGEILRRARADLQEQLKTFLDENVKIDYFCFRLRNEDGSESSSETSETEVTAGEYNKEILKKCEEIRKGLKDGSLDFAAEAEKADGFENNSIANKKRLAQVFGESAENRAPGDLVFLTDEMFAYIFLFKEIAEEDFPRSTEPTEEELSRYKEESLSKSFTELLKKYRSAVITDELLLEKYKSPWEIK